MSLGAFLGVLRRRWLVALLCVVAGGAGASFVTHRTVPVYLASAQLIVAIPDTRTASDAVQGVRLSADLLQSYSDVATSRNVATKIKNRLGLPESADALRRHLRAIPKPNTLLISISADDPDPVRAAEIANAASDVFIESVAEFERDKVAKIEAQVIDSATPPSDAFTPRPNVNLILGLLLGVTTGVCLALILDALDRSVKTSSQSTAVLRAPILGLIPRIKQVKDYPNSLLEQPLSAGSEAYRALRTAIHFLDLDHPLRTILVTSPSAGEGKTTTAVNLAVTLAQSGERVILVDADLRRGRLVDVMGLPAGAGVTSVVTRAADLSDCQQDWRGMLDVLGSGPLPPNPSEILGSNAMVSLLSALSAMADVVVIDGAPVLPVTDSVVLATQVDGVIVVARSGKTHRSAAAEARHRLESVGANVAGWVLNGISASAAASYYGDYQYLASRPGPGRSRAGSWADRVRGRRGVASGDPSE